MKRSIPMSSASPATGTAGNADSVAASVMKPPRDRSASFGGEDGETEQAELL
jgi:hypothetical protein